MSRLLILDPPPEINAGINFTLLAAIKIEVSDDKLVISNVLLENSGMRGLQDTARYRFLDLESNVDTQSCEVPLRYIGGHDATNSGVILIEQALTLKYEEGLLKTHCQIFWRLEGPRTHKEEMLIDWLNRGGLVPEQVVVS